MNRAGSPLLLVLALVMGCHRTGRATATPAERAPAPTSRESSGEAETVEPGSPTSDDEPEGAAPAAAAAAATPLSPDDPTSGASFRAQLTLPRPSPATRMAKLSPAECMKELAARSLPFTRSKQAAAGVATALRSSGPLRGVRIVIPRAPSLFGVTDCRVALALDDLASVAAEHGVVEIQVDNAYRPKAHLPGKGSKSQHAYGLALDVTQVRLRDGTVLRVEPDWHAPIGSVSCGPDARMDDPTPASIALRDLVCDVARRGIFHHILSPSWDAAHHNHLHLDIARNASRQAMH